MVELDKSLSQVFIQAKQDRGNLDTSDPRSHGYRESIQAAIHGLEECRKLIDNMALFSPNEIIEEVSTQNLQFLNVNYLLADLLLKSYDSDRRAAVQRASDLLNEFLTRLDQYEFFSPRDRKLYERFQENPTTFSLMSASNPEERRKVKIDRFREEKTLKQKLEHLQTQSRSNNMDDEIVRDLYLAELAFSVNQAFSSLDMISQEISILSQMPPNGVRQDHLTADPDSRVPRRSDGHSERLDGPMTVGGLGRQGGPILSASGQPLQPFTLLDKRTQLQQGVFRPGHNLPTMSIDEYLEEERKRGGIIEGGGNANAPQPEPDEDNMALVDAATIKAREWDEFVEANPKGAGNTLNRG